MCCESVSKDVAGSGEVDIAARRLAGVPFFVFVQVRFEGEKGHP